MASRARYLSAWGIASLLAAGALPALELSGRIVLAEKGLPSSDRSLRPENSVVVFEPERAGPRPKPVIAEMATVRKEFSPRLLVVPVGSTVRFPNQDPILHNVFSVSGKNRFDLGLLGNGPGKAATFHEAGIVRVFCNVHHAMFAYVYVVASAHFTRAEPSGGFHLRDLPPGAGKLTIWHERGAPVERRVEVPTAAPLEVVIDVSLPRIPPHKNKFGKSYGGASYG